MKVCIAKKISNDYFLKFSIINFLFEQCIMFRLLYVSKIVSCFIKNNTVNRAHLFTNICLGSSKFIRLI
jgi:hypothetical protein